MSNVTEEPKPKKLLSESKRAWLCQMIGGQLLYAPDTGLTAKDGDGAYIDLFAIHKEVGHLSVKEGDKDADPEVIKKKKLLAQYGFPSIADASKEFKETSSKKREKLAEVRNLIELQKEEIRKATDFEVTVKKRMEIQGHEILYGEKKVKSKDEKAEKSYDKEHYKDRVISGPTKEQRMAIKAVMEQLELLMQKLKNDEEVDFSPQELMNELWTPMLREGLINEDECPDEFSRVLQLFRGASELYNKRLQATARVEPDKFEDARNHLTDVSDILGIGAGAADIILSIVGVGGDVQKILSIATKCAQSGIKSTSALLEKQKDFQSAGAGIGEILGNVLAFAIGENGKEIGALAKTAFNGCVSIALLGKKFAERDYENAFDMLADSVGAALSCIGDATDNKAIGKIANSASATLKGAFKTGQLVYLLNQDPVNMTEVKKLMAQIASSAISLGIRNGLDNHPFKEERQKIESQMKGLDEKSPEYVNLKKALTKLENEQTGKLDGLDAIFSGLVDDKGAIMKELSKEVEGNVLKKGAETSEKELAEGRETFNKQLAAAFNMSVGADGEDAEYVAEMYSIDALIAQIERDRATLEIFNLIFDSAGAILTTFIPQLGGPLKAKAFAMNVVAAAERSFELFTFVELVSDARKAGSPQFATLLAEVDELKRHLTNDTLEAAIALGQAVSLSVAAVGDAAAGAMGTGAVAGFVGRTVSSALDVFKQSKDKLIEKFEEKKTAEAWEMYKKALANPRDRKHILETFISNPTLAKYGLAYGAIEMEDPIAREALRQLGLNDVVLAQEESGTDKVVLFLETKFSDDIVVEGVLSRFAPDPDAPLTLGVWVKNKEAAASEENPAEGRWLTVKTTAIDTAIRDVETSTKDIARNDISKIYKPDMWAKCEMKYLAHIENLNRLSEVLLAFKPQNINQAPFPQFQNYLNELSTVAKKQAEEAKSKMEIQKATLQSQVSALKNVTTFGKQCNDAIDTALPKFRSAKDLSTKEIQALFLPKGAASELVKFLKDTTSTTPKLITSVNFFAHSVSAQLRGIDRALQAVDEKAAKVITDNILDSLLTDANSCKDGIANQMRLAEDEIKLFPVF